MRKIILSGIVLILLSFNIPAHAQEAADGPDMFKLLDDIAAYMATARFVPGTTRQASVYVQDIKRHTEITYNPDVKYSGASVTKIGVLAAFQYYAQGHQPGGVPTREQAVLIAQMILCSSNEATNKLIQTMGDKDAQKGLDYISYFSGMYLNRLYSGDGAPLVTDGPILPKDADADPNNFLDIESFGRALAKATLWATDPPLEVNFPDEVVINRKLIHVMAANKTGALLEGGVPEGTFVAHKQGWVQDTHGDAGYFITPGGDYVIVIMLHQRKFLQSTNSFPAIAEVSRLVYNAFNPTAPLKAIRSKPIPKECTIPPSVVDALMTADAPPLPVAIK